MRSTVWLWAVAVTVGLTGCSGQKTSDFTTPKNAEAAEPMKNSIQLTPISTSVLQPSVSLPNGWRFVDVNHAPKEVADVVSSNVEQTGTEEWNFSGKKYLIIRAGEKQSGGYSIVVDQIQQNKGQYMIHVHLKKPQGMATSALTYPVLVVEMPVGTDVEVQGMQQLEA